MLNPKRLNGRAWMLLLLLGALVSTARAQNEPEPAVYAFVDVNVIPMDTKRVLERQTVIVRDGRIEHIGPADATDVPAGAEEIDGYGRYLMPGLADMHVHAWDLNEFPLYLANGVTTIRNMFGSEIQLGWQRRQEIGRLFGPTIYTAGPIIDGDPPVWPGSAVPDSPEEAAAIVRQQKAAGYQFAKVYNKLPLEVYDAIMSTAKEIDFPVTGHVPWTAGLRHVLESGQRSIEHLDGYLMACQKPGSPALHADDMRGRRLAPVFFDESKLPEVVEATVRADTWNCPTLVVMQRWMPREQMERFLRRPEMRYVSPATRATWNPDQDFRLKTFDAEGFALLRQADELRLRITGALHEAGAKLLLGTDTPNPLVVPGFAIHDELANLVSAGLTPYEALVTGTRHPAEFLGVPDEFGTVAPGRRADLLLLHANPLDDVGNVKRLAGVMVRGQWLGSAELRDRLESLASQYEEETAREDPFAGLEPLPIIGTGLFTGRFEMHFGDLTMGNERFTWRRRDDGTEAIFAQAVYVPPTDAILSMRHELPTNPQDDELLSFSLASHGVEALIHASHAAGQLEISGRSTAGHVHDHQTVAEGVALGGRFLASEAVVARRLLARLEVGGTLELPRKTITLFPSFTIVDSRVRYERRADETVELPSGRQVATRVYHAVLDGDADSDAGSTLYVDEAGFPVAMEVRQRMGLLRFTRID